MTNLSKKAFQAAQGDGFEVSFEMFPARTETGRQALCAMARRLEPFGPEYISVTYGAGGSSRDSTIETIKALKASVATPICGHLTCSDASREETLEVARIYRDMGITHIVALRGDPKAGETAFRPHPQGFANAAELIAALRDTWPDMHISMAAYPEVHPESPSPEADLENLQAKFAAGANEALTQFFFDNELYRDFLARARAAGIDGQIVPGIMLIQDFFKVRNFARKCQASIPPWLEARFAGVAMDSQEHKLLTAAYAMEQVLDLAACGVRRFHLFTMNRPELAEAICRVLGLARDRAAPENSQTGKHP